LLTHPVLLLFWRIRDVLSPALLTTQEPPHIDSDRNTFKRVLMGTFKSLWDEKFDEEF